MAGACPPGLAIEVANVGGMGAMGALLSQPEAIADWVSEFRTGSNGSFQLNLWVPGPPPMRDADAGVGRTRGGAVPQRIGRGIRQPIMDGCA